MDVADRGLRRAGRALPVAALCCAACAGAPTPAVPDEPALLARARADLAEGRAEAAQRGFEAVLEHDPHSLAGWRGRVEAAGRRGALPELAGELAAATRARPADATAWYALGLARFAQSRKDDGIAALSRAAALQPRQPDIQYRLGAALLGADRLGEARGPLSRAVELAPGVARHGIALAICLNRMGERRAGMDVLRDLSRFSLGAEEAALAVRAARALSDPFRDVPPSARADLEAGLAYLAGEPAGLAIRPVESLLERFPELAASHLLAGLAAERLDEAGRAASELKRAAELDPQLPQPHAYLAELYEAKDRPELAAAEYAAALERNPLEVATLRKLGLLRLERLKRPREALEPLRQAGALAPADDALQLLIARAELGAGEMAAGRDRLESLARRRPHDADVLLRLALALYEERGTATTGRAVLTRRVEELVRQVLALEPQNAAASRLLAALEAS